MTNQKSDKPLVRNWIIASLIAITVVHIIWWNQLFHQGNPSVFVVIDVILLAVFSLMAVQAYSGADDPNKEWKLKVVIGLTVAILLWAGGWAAGINERVGL